VVYYIIKHYACVQGLNLNLNGVYMSYEAN